MSKADRAKRRQKARAAMAALASVLPHARRAATTDRIEPPPPPAARVLPEQRDKGVWAEPPKGHGGGVINLAPDMIGRLGFDRLLTPAQVDAARRWQEIEAGWLAQLGAKGYRSCLDMTGGGHDGGDGDPAAIRAYDALCDRIGRICVATLKLECGKPDGAKPNNLAVLRNCLDVVGR
jgi:hypothetical protein